MIALDEATSSLDTASEVRILSALENLLQGRTALIIAHRLTTIVNADLILVMDDGRIVQAGTHEELLIEEDGLCSRLWARRFGGTNEPDGWRLDGPDGLRTRPVVGGKAGRRDAARPRREVEPV